MADFSTGSSSSMSNPRMAVCSKEQLVQVLKDMIVNIEANDSFEGQIIYTCMEDGLQPGQFYVQAFVRVDNSMGQGGVKIIGQPGDDFEIER